MYEMNQNNDLNLSNKNKRRIILSFHEKMLQLKCNVKRNRNIEANLQWMKLNQQISNELDRPTIKFSKESISPDAEFHGESFGDKFNIF